MKRNDDRSPFRPQGRWYHVVQRILQMAQFVVDGDSQRLKDSRGRLPSCLSLIAAGNRLAHRLNQIPGRSNGPTTPPNDQLTSNSPTETFLSILRENICQFCFGFVLDQFPGRLAFGRVEPEIERPAGFEAETPLAVGQLIGRQPEIQQDSIDLLYSQLFEDIGKLVVAGMPQETVRALHDRRGKPKHHRITIQPDQCSLRPDLFQDCSTVTTRSDRPVDDDLSRLQFEVTDHLAQQNRFVDRRNWSAEIRRCLGHVQDEM
jgi:hypothetical protein